MKNKTTLLLTSLILINTFLFSQNESLNRHLTDSSRSIQFGISYIYLQPFNGKSISYKTHFSDRTALRMGVTLSGSYKNEDVTTYTYTNDTLESINKNSYSLDPSILINCSAEYLWYRPASDNFYIFYGGGPMIGYSQSEYSFDDFNRRWTIGITGSLGAEWLASSSFSIHGEYAFNATYRFSRENEWRYGGSTKSHRVLSTSNTFDFDSQFVSFGASVYF